MHDKTLWHHKIFAFILVSFFSLAIVAMPISFAWASPINRSTVVELTNNQRAQIGVSVLKPNYELTLAAQNKADDMMQNGYWEHYHNGKTPWDWMEEADYKFSSAGENLAIDFNDAESLMSAWMGSTTHRQNVVNPLYEEIGIGIAQGWFNDHETTIVVQFFGKPKITQNLSKLDETQKPIADDNNVNDLYNEEPKEIGSTKFFKKIKNLYESFYWKMIGFFV